ncbi:glycosyl hydrolase family 18 protein [Paenibacillus alkaliterrae]|uniref:glycosyl hydrolase family 18 protein n=1 Tax=Paenibacillus alkaliterrae TaxID=320909 RepID=UPI001F3057E0|nr:glycosyl hydrolase family 18 protein [Paenibacillus alkaliterrae]MCF2936960.1 glycosyl hydrolase family 18 protein [Paenibacillus alkaliterrae]
MNIAFRRMIVVLMFVVFTWQAAAGTADALGSNMLNGKPLQTADYVTVAKVTHLSAPVHVKALSGSAKVATLKRGVEYPVISVAKYHYQVQLLGGKKGWIRKSYVSVRKANRYVSGWNYLGGTDKFIEVSDIAALDVVMPRWYRLSQDGLVSTSPDKRYVDWAHSKGKKVWAMLGNGFDMELTDRVLSSPANRQEVISKVKDSVLANGIDGINVDFENMKLENREEFVIFIRDLKKSLSAGNKLVSVDVTRENPDPNWSGSYDRAGLGKAADYVIMMGYDEYYEGRGEAGSVSSLPWVEEGLRLLLKDVPAHKVILGVPFYTREWTVPAGGGKATSKDVFMKDTDVWISERGLTKKWDSVSRQNYVEFTDTAGRHRLWVEDRISMAARWSLVKKYSLAGISAWAIGQESADIWSVFK